MGLSEDTWLNAIEIDERKDALASDSPRVDNDPLLFLVSVPVKPLSQIRKAIWRMPEGQARREMERVSANVRSGREVVLARDTLGRTVGAAVHESTGGVRWIVNMASTGEVKGTGKALLRGVARVAKAHGEVLEMAALNEAALGFFVSQGGTQQIDDKAKYPDDHWARGGRALRWQGEALECLAKMQEESL